LPFIPPIDFVGYDCPAFKDIHDFMKKIAGGTLAAAEALMSGEYQNAINWCGGWHHAQRYNRQNTDILYPRIRPN